MPTLDNNPEVKSGYVFYRSNNTRPICVIRPVNIFAMVFSVLSFIRANVNLLRAPFYIVHHSGFVSPLSREFLLFHR